MNMILQVIFKQLSKLVMVACSEKVIMWLIFHLLELAVASSKTHFDDELLEQIKEAYAKRESEPHAEIKKK